MKVKEELSKQLRKARQTHESRSMHDDWLKTLTKALTAWGCELLGCEQTLFVADVVCKPALFAAAVCFCFVLVASQSPRLAKCPLQSMQPDPVDNHWAALQSKAWLGVVAACVAWRSTLLSLHVLLCPRRPRSNRSAYSKINANNSALQLGKREPR